MDRRASRSGEEQHELALPEELAAALAADSETASTYARLPFSHRREYAIWVAEAKRAETRRRRAQQAVEMLAKRTRPG